MRDLRYTLPKNEDKKYYRRSVDAITDVIIHHSAVPGTPETFADYHIHHHKWPGIGYHYVIDKSGEIYYCNSIDLITYHTQGNNSKSIGICVIGNYEDEKVSAMVDAQLHMLLFDIYSTIGHFTLGYHAQYKPTKCCGKNLIDHIKEMKFPERWTLKK